MMLDYREIPIINGIGARIGKIMAYEGYACNPDPEIVILGFFSAIPQIIYTFYKPDPVDFLTDRFGRGHHRKRRRRFRAAGRILPKIQTGTSGLRYVTFSATALVERVGWYILVIDASLDFVVNWTSMAWQWQGCQSPGAGWAQRYRNTTGNRTANQWAHVTNTDKPGNVLFSYVLNAIRVPPLTNYSINASVQGLPPIPPSTAVLTGVRIIDGASTIEGSVTDGDDGSKIGTVWEPGFFKRSGASSHNVFFQGLWTGSGTGRQAAGAFYTLTGTQLDPFAPDP